MEYTIRRAPESLGEPTADWDHPLWATADTLEIALYRWEDSGHHPPTRTRVLYDDEHLAAIFRVEDRFVRAVAEKFGDPVSADSCVEFFLSPFPMTATNAYFNFELNCGGILLLRRCSSTTERAWGRPNPMLAEEDAGLVRHAPAGRSGNRRANDLVRRVPRPLRALPALLRRSAATDAGNRVEGQLLQVWRRHFETTLGHLGADRDRCPQLPRAGVLSASALWLRLRAAIRLNRRPIVSSPLPWRWICKVEVNLYMRA